MPPSANFICPLCGESTLTITASMQLGSNEHDDDHTLQRVSCSEDAFEGAAEYRASRRGRGESRSHQGKEASEEFREELEDAIDSCEDPGNKRCDCAGHQRAREMELYREPGEWFPMRFGD